MSRRRPSAVSTSSIAPSGLGRRRFCRSSGRRPRRSAAPVLRVRSADHRPTSPSWRARRATPRCPTSARLEPWEGAPQAARPGRRPPRTSPPRRRFAVTARPRVVQSCGRLLPSIVESVIHHMSFGSRWVGEPFRASAVRAVQRDGDGPADDDRDEAVAVTASVDPHDFGSLLGFRTLVTWHWSSGALPTRSTFTSKPEASS